MRKIKFLVACIIFIVFSVGCFGKSSALSGKNFLDKAYLEGVYSCYVNNHLKTGIGAQSPITINDFPVFLTSLLPQSGKHSFLIVNAKDGQVLIPTDLSGINDDDLSCDELFVGYKGLGGKFDGVLNLAGMQSPTEEAAPEVKKEYMEKLGYESSNAEEVSGICSSINFTYTHKTITSTSTNVNTERDAKTYSLCAEGLGDGNKITNNTSLSVEQNDGENFLSFNIKDGQVKISYLKVTQDYNYRYKSERVNLSFSLDGSSTWEKFMNDIANSFNDITVASPDRGVISNVGGTYIKGYELKKTGTINNYDKNEVTKIFTMENREEAANTAISYFSNNEFKKYDDLKYTPSQEIALYQEYIEKTFSSEFYNNCEGEFTDSEVERLLMSGYKKVKWYVNNTTKVCYIKSEKESTIKEVNGVKSDGHFGEKISTDSNSTAYEKIINKLENLTLADGESPDPEIGQVDEGDMKPDPCYENAGSLGWVICPVMNKISEALSELYDNMIEPFLVVNPELVSTSGGTHDAWMVMVRIANVLVVIYLLVVIFSQLTGVGIDNYGIKKSLPKIIVVAILINLSYVICQLAVDVSNILGNSLNSLLQGINVEGLPANVSGLSDNAAWFKALFNVTAGGLVSIGVVSVVAESLNSGVLAGLVIPILLLLVTALVAVLFFFILLGVRKAAVVLLVVLAPIAITCYALPNTKKYFDKWIKAFQAMLLLYPICGLLIGGGQLASKIILSASDDYIMYFTGCLMLVVPFFFVPVILKGSFTAMGNIGAKVSGFGKMLGQRGRNKLDGTIKNSDAYKNRVQYNQQQQAARRAQRIKTRLDRRSGGNVANLSARQQDRLSRANEALRVEANRQQQARINADNANFNAALAKQSLQNDETAQDTLLYNNADFIVAQQTKGQNARTDRQAEADVGVFTLNQAIARSRAQSRRDAQELRAYQDQFAGFSQAQLRTEAGSASTWLSQPGGTQRMSALISAMEANGMERDIFSTIRLNNVSSNAGIMSTLAASKNKVLRAYGKKGQGIDYNTFMSGTGAGSLQSYVQEKGKDFIDGLDDKALAEIASYNVGGRAGGAMSTDLLVEAAAKINSQDAVDQIDGMLQVRNDFNDNISGEQIVHFNDSTVTRLMSNTRARAAMDKATDAVANDPRLVGMLSANRKQLFNAAFRNGSTKPYM